MLDESLPTFVVQPSRDKPKQNSTFLFSQHGRDYEPCYAIQHLDPEQHSSRNRYAIGLHDAHVPEVLYAEVLLIPGWTQPSLSAEQIRLNGGVAPPPEPIVPSEFAIQLYNPDQQIVVKYRPPAFTRDATWDFEMPQQTFREPSSSALDRSQHDPVALDLTPKIRLKWRKESKFNKDLVCYQSGKSMNPDGTARKNREPNITMAIFKGLREVTFYESNFNRLDLEDAKGFEVVLLLGALVIRDVYFSPMKETFTLSGSGRRASTTSPPVAAAVPPAPRIRPPVGAPARDPRIPPTDPLTQWELDKEAAHLKRQAAEEAREQQRKDEAEQRRIKKMLDAEEKEARKRQAEIDKETERLRRLYGQEDASARPALPTRPQQQTQQPQHIPQQQQYYRPPAPAPPAPYMSGAAQSSLLSPNNGPVEQQQRIKPKHSFFGFRAHSDQESQKITKKRSSMF